MKTWAKVILWIVGSLLTAFVVFIGTLWFMFAPENWSKRKARFEKAEVTGMTVIAAINKYTAEHNEPPPDLHVLVPQYLSHVPPTGLRDYPDFEYHTFTNSKSTLAWYDLGSRDGAPMAGLWIYVEGKPENAILALTVDQNDRVVGARTDRMPKEHAQKPFDLTKWQQNDSRIEMIRSITNTIKLKGATLTEIRESLGEPDGISILRNSPWELRIECSNGILNWDVFFYWPTEDYPKNIYGGHTELIGRWAYVHE